MERQTIFRESQETTYSDLNNPQVFAREAIDHVVHDAVTNERGFSGFAVTKTAATEVSVAAGRLFESGPVFQRTDVVTFDFLANLPLTTKKIIAVVTYGQVIETDVQPRDFLINVETQATEPQAVPMEQIRQAQINTVSGAENASPTRPVVDAALTVIAWVTLDTIGVESIEMNEASYLPSVKKNAGRLDEFDTWRDGIGSRLDTLATDISGLNDSLAGAGRFEAIYQVAGDVARIKEQLELESGTVDYGADRFLDASQSDTDNVNYLARVEEGIRFGHAGEDESQLALFNPLDTNISVSNGFLLPAYDEELRMSVNPKEKQSLSISQYGYQAVEYGLKSVARHRARYGESFVISSANNWWQTGVYNWQKQTFERDGETFTVVQSWETNKVLADGKKALRVRLRKVWQDSWSDPHWDAVRTNHTVNGSVVAQTFLNSQDGWLVRLNLKFLQIGPSGAVDVVICETKDGKPDLANAIQAVTIPHEDLVLWDEGDFLTGGDSNTKVTIPPTFLTAGKRYAMVLVTNGNHHVATAQGSAYSEGTLFYSTDGVFYQGDLTKDIAFGLRFAKFQSPRIEVELDALSLSGGIAAIDILANAVIPQGTDLIYEIQPSGSGEWFALDTIVDGNTKLYNLPALVKLRAVFLGTSDSMPGLGLTDSRVNISRPRTDLLHISEAITLASTTQSLKIVVTLNEFFETNHDFTAVIDDVTNAANAIAPATVTDTVLEAVVGDANHKRIRRTFEWTATELTVATSQFVIHFTGTTTSALDVFVAEERVHLAF